MYIVLSTVTSKGPTRIPLAKHTHDPRSGQLLIEISAENQTLISAKIFGEGPSARSSAEVTQSISTE
jgi:hypothetical protein